jgi:peptidoglycan/xylan/chitin deacetylase (PgdA/CDA1 family)
MDFYGLFYRTLHGRLSRCFPGCLWGGDPTRAEVALTFDDGPHRRYTPALLDVLGCLGVRASFFVLGCQVENTPEIARDIVRAGHWVGLHGFWHMPFLDPHRLRADLACARSVLAAACGPELGPVWDVRPPYGVASPAALAALNAWGYRPVMWQVVSDDSLRPGVGAVVDRTLRQTGNGALIVLHDGNDGAGPHVAKATGLIVRRLLAEGYRFVTVDDFWKRRRGDHPRGAA